MTKLPVVSAKEAIRCFEKLGYTVVRQKGSHIRMKHTDNVRKPLTIPNHSTIRKGLLRKLLRDAKVSVSEFEGLR